MRASWAASVSQATHQARKSSAAATRRNACSIAPMKALTLVLVVLLAACGDDKARPSQPDAGPAGCNPLIGDDCLSPFPSSFHEAADATSTTGVRVALPKDLLP